MGLLDELRSEATQQKVSDARSRVLGERRTSEAEVKLRPRMVALHRYFKEFIDHLSVINPEVTTRLEVADFGVVTSLKQESYRFWTEQPDDPTRFTFGFTASSKQRPQIRLTQVVADKLLADLKKQNIPCVAGQVDSGHTTLVLQPQIPVLFEFKMDVERETVRLCLRNYERLGTLNYAYEADEITEALMEQLGLLVLGKPNRFKVMSGGVVEDSRRDELRRALGREERRRNAELGGVVSKLSWAVGEGLRKLFVKS